MGKYDWNRGFVIDVGAVQGSPCIIERHLSDMTGFFQDSRCVRDMLEHDDPLIYTYQSIPQSASEGDIAFGMTIVYPGMVGNEYFMTKGHFHDVRDTAEVYHCLGGEGLMIIDNGEGDCRALELSESKAAYVPKGYAHRTVNTSDKPLRVFFAFPANAGHNYGTIEKSGFARLALCVNGKYSLEENERHK